MSAETIRRAAALTRQRADAAKRWEGDEGWWTAIGLEEAFTAYMDDDARHGEREDAEHLASFDPATGLVLADLLDAAADEIERRVARDGEQILEHANPVFHAMTELARTYLREEGS